MTVGFQCFNTAGAFQIDGVYPQFVFKRKVVVTCNLLQRASSAIGHWTGDFWIGSTEIAAIVSDVPCCIKRQVNGEARLATPTLLGHSSSTVTVYIFASVSPIASSYGFQVFNPAGTLVFDAAQKPLAMVGFPVGEGNFTYDSSRIYAAVCLNQYLYITSTGHDYGSDHHVTITAGMVKMISGGINISNVMIYDDTESMDPNQSAFDESVPVYSPNRHIIVDVTNY